MKLKQVLFLLLGCNYNPKNSTFLPPEVKWTNNDEHPSIDDCDKYDIEIDRINCFKSKIITLIYSNINLEDKLVSNKINDTGNGTMPNGPIDFESRYNKTIWRF